MVTVFKLSKGFVSNAVESEVADFNFDIYYLFKFGCLLPFFTVLELKTCNF